MISLAKRRHGSITSSCLKILQNLPATWTPTRGTQQDATIKDEGQAEGTLEANFSKAGRVFDELQTHQPNDLNTGPPMPWRRESSVLGRLPERVGGRELCREVGKLPPSLFCLLGVNSRVAWSPRPLDPSSLRSDIYHHLLKTLDEVNYV